jgi:hypothetical protein
MKNFRENRHVLLLYSTELNSLMRQPHYTVH